MKLRLTWFAVFATFVCLIASAGRPARRGGRTPTTLPPLFPCSGTVDNPYGVCTHITRPHMDYPYMERELKLTRDLGIGWIRSDFDFGTVFGSATDFAPQFFDEVLSSVANHSQRLLPILTWLGSFPWDDPTYGAYVDSLSNRYRGKIAHWEIMNEVDFMGGIDSLAQKYARSLKVASDRLHAADPENKVLLTGLGGVGNPFVDGMFRLGAMENVDIMNFHSYFSPEDNILACAKIDSLMHLYGQRKPVWMTECGMNTCRDTCPADGFYRQLLPYALERIGIDESRICVGYIADRTTGYVALTPYQADEYLKPCAASVLPVSFSELKRLDVKKIPVLVTTSDEFFPDRFFPDIEDYVRRGGTIVLSGGYPFYYDATTVGEANLGARAVADSNYSRLHMAHLDSKTDPVTGEELSAVPPLTWRDAGNSCPYGWKVTPFSPARYLSGDNLHEGDTLIPLLWAGTEYVGGVIAGIYKLRSELRGNIVFQTRMYFNPPVFKEAEQARRVARTYIIALSQGIERVFWYNLRSREDDSGEAEDNFGLIHKDFSEKPACQAYRTMTQMLPSGSSRPALQVDGNVYEARWVRPDGKCVIAMWSPCVPYKKKADWSRKAVFYSHLGECLGTCDKGVTLTDAVLFRVE
jgi:hypothetical protein